MPINRNQPVPQVGYELDGKCGVYALIDPRTSKVMYVGQSQDIGQRYRQHCQGEWARNGLKQGWIGGLLDLGLYPKIQVIQECEFPESLNIEREVIRRFRAEGQCELNIAEGGGGCSVSHLSNTNKDDWIELGKKIKLVDSLLTEIAHDVGPMAGAKGVDMILLSMRNWSKTKIKFEGMLHKRFPDWAFVSHVFWGPNDPPQH